jgi:stringent starvation protein B
VTRKEQSQRLLQEDKKEGEEKSKKRPKLLRTLHQWPGVYELHPEIVQEANLRALQMIMSQSQQQSLLLSL